MTRTVDVDKLRKDCEAELEFWAAGRPVLYINGRAIKSAGAKEILSLLDELKEKTQALEWYSNQHNWDLDNDDNGTVILSDDWQRCTEMQGTDEIHFFLGGKLAREVLKKYE